MTQRQARNLFASQIGRVTPNAFDLLSRKKMSPKLLHEILLMSHDDTVLYRAGYYLEEKVLKRDKRALSILNKLADEKINPNERSRYVVVSVLDHLAEKGYNRALAGLAKALEDSNHRHQISAAQALRRLAKSANMGAREILTKRKIAW